jgi:nitroreductase
MLMKNNIIQQLNWRYATKTFDKDKKISQENLDILLESLRLTPSSFGLQPWKFIVIKNPEIREKIKAVAYGQSQVADASDLIILCAKENITEADVVKITGENEVYKNMVMGAVGGRNVSELLN